MHYSSDNLQAQWSKCHTVATYFKYTFQTATQLPKFEAQWSKSLQQPEVASTKVKIDRKSVV